MASAGEILLGKYRVERELGRGGMGAVVAALHLELDERVAIKFLLPEFSGRPELVQRFVREAKAACRIKSDHIARVSDVGRLPSGEPYMVMEYLEGKDLEGVLEERGPLPVADAVDYVLQGMEAIAEAHSLHIVHRDLKPANMFLTRRADGSAWVKILDFGISKFTSDASAGGAMTQTQGMMGSPLYMSPEQLQSAKDVDARADIWSLGVILYQLLTAAFPFNAETIGQLVAAVLQVPPTPLAAHRPDLPESLDAVVKRCLAKPRDERFATVAELATALAPFASRRGRLSVENITGTIHHATAGEEARDHATVAESADGSEERRCGHRHADECKLGWNGRRYGRTDGGAALAAGAGRHRAACSRDRRHGRLSANAFPPC